MHDNAPFHAARTTSALLAIGIEDVTLTSTLLSILKQNNYEGGRHLQGYPTTPTALIVQGKTVVEQEAQVIQWKQPRFGEGDNVTPQGEGQPRSDNHKQCNAAPRKMPLPCGLYREHWKLVQSGYKLRRSIKKCTARTRGEKVERKVPIQCNRFPR